MSSSFEGHSLTSSFEGQGRVPIATQENVDLDFDPNYQSVSANSDVDPNYETVEEANSKAKYEEINGTRPKKLIRPHIYEVPDEKRKYEVVDERDVITKDGKIRAHVYEEVTEPSEARRIKQMALSRHMYEEVVDVKGQGSQGQNGKLAENKGQGHGGKVKKAAKGAEGHSGDLSKEKDKKKKGHERIGSGDLFSFVKKKDDKHKDDKHKDGHDKQSKEKEGKRKPDK